MRRVNFKIIVVTVVVFLFLLSSTSQTQVITPSQPQRVTPGAAVPEMAVSLPDLVITNYRMQPPQPTSQDKVLIYFDIKNIGSIPASFPKGATIWRMEGYKDGNSLGMETRYLEVSNGMTIQPQSSIQRALTLAPGGGMVSPWTSGGMMGLSPGAYQIIVKVDPFNAVKEFSEKNNMYVSNFNVPRFTESIKATPPSNVQKDWRLSQQNAINVARELQNYDCSRGLTTNIETELKLSDKTMNTAEQLLSKKPINRQIAGPIVEDLSTHIKILENLIEGVRNKKQECQTTFENFDQKANQLVSILSSVLKSMKEMQEGVIRNML